MSAVLDTVQEHRAEEAAERLKVSVALKEQVLRDGQQTIVPARDLVPGDVVLLSAGDLVPAHGRILVSRDFLVGRWHALPSRRLPMDKITCLDGRFRYCRAASMGGVMQRRLGCYCHYTEEGGRNPKAASLLSSPVGYPDLREGLMQ